MTAGPTLGYPGYRIAQWIWASMIVLLMLLMGVVITLGGPPRPAMSPDVLLALTIGASVFGILLARTLPHRMSPRDPGRAELVALTRLIIAWALCEAVAIFPLIALLMTRDLRLLAVFVVDLAVLALWAPTRARWEAMSGTAAAAARGRMVR